MQRLCSTTERRYSITIQQRALQTASLCLFYANQTVTNMNAVHKSRDSWHQAFVHECTPRYELETQLP